MTRTVWKYELDPGLFVRGRCELVLPKGAQLVLFGHQDGQWFAWFEVLVPTMSSLVETEHRNFWIVGTGHEIREGQEHRASFQAREPDGADYVWHLYEEASDGVQ